MIRIALVTILVVLFSSCSDRNENDTAKNYYNVDSLLNKHMAGLTSGKTSFRKFARINQKTDTTVITPDSLGWINELAVFKHLDIINKPIYRGAYSVTNEKDPNSNLTVRSYVANRNIPIQEFKIYYLATLNNLKKIEALTTETNTLCTTQRKMRIDFDQTIVGYELTGVQKMILSDTVRFSILSKIIIP